MFKDLEKEMISIKKENKELCKTTLEKQNVILELKENNLQVIKLNANLQSQIQLQKDEINHLNFVVMNNKE